MGLARHRVRVTQTCSAAHPWHAVVGDLTVEPRVKCGDQRRIGGRAGELVDVDVDVKKLGRIPDGCGHRALGRQAGKKNRSGVGHCFLHSAIDDHSRLVYSEMVTNEKKETAAGFWERANEFYAETSSLRRSSAASSPTGWAEFPPVESFASEDGLGVLAVVDGHLVLVGRPRWLQEQWGIALPADLEAQIAAAEEQGRTAVAVAWDGQAKGVLAVSDLVKASSAAAVAEFRRLGLRPILLTGDNERVARAVAAEVGITDVTANVLPAEKAAAIRALQKQGRVVAMVGDGVNDAVALATADLGIAMGTGTDVAIEASDLTLVRSDLVAAADAIRLSRRTLATIKANLFWAFAYNIAAIPLAMLGLLNPLISGAAMGLSSIFVVTNSLRLRGFR
jgi:soluble P-type ATPase